MSGQHRRARSRQHLRKRADSSQTVKPHADTQKHAQETHHTQQHHGHNAHDNHHDGSHKAPEGHEGSHSQSHRESHEDHHNGGTKEPSKAPSQPAPSVSTPPSLSPQLLPADLPTKETASPRMSKAQIGELAGGIAVFALLSLLLGSYLYYRFVVQKKRDAKLAIANRLSIKDRENQDMRGLGSIYGAPPEFRESGRGTRSNTSSGTLLDPFTHHKGGGRELEPGYNVSKGEDGMAKEGGPFEFSSWSALSSRVTLARPPSIKQQDLPSSPKPRLSVTGTDSSNQSAASEFEIDRCLSYYVKTASFTGSGLQEPVAPKQYNLLERVKMQQEQQRDLALLGPAHVRTSTDSALSSASTLRAEPTRQSEHTIRAVSGGVFEYTRYQQDGGHTSTSSRMLSTESDAGAKRLSRRSIYSQDSGPCCSDTAA